MLKSLTKIMCLCLVLTLGFAATVFAADVNLATKAKITTSSDYSPEYAGTKVADGIYDETGAWAALGELEPWIKFEWTEPVTIGKIIISDRPNEIDNVNGGTLTFSDGTKIEVKDLDPKGEGKVITFDPKTVTSVQFDCTGDEGMNNGLSEFEIYASASSEPAPAAKAAADDSASTAPQEKNPKTGDMGALAYVLTAGASAAVMFVKARKK